MAELMLFGAGVQSYANVLAGRESLSAAKVQAGQLRRSAGTMRAASQRDAADLRRRKDMVSSRARAVMAAQGGSLDDPTAVDLLAGIEAEGELQALNRLWVGEDQARGYEDAATSTIAEGRAARTGGYISAAATLMTGVGQYKWMK